MLILPEKQIRFAIPFDYVRTLEEEDKMFRLFYICYARNTFSERPEPRKTPEAI